MKGEKLLRTTLLINAAFSFLSGIDFMVFDRQISGLVFKVDGFGIAAIGAMLLVFAAFVFVVARMKDIHRGLVITIILMDIGWVTSSVLLVTFADLFTFFGGLAVLLIATVIALFAFLQTKGLRRINGQPA